MARMAEGKMRKRFIEDPLEFDLEELQKFGKRVENLEEAETKQFSREGVCDECGALSVVTKIKGKVLCGTCSNNIRFNFKHK